MIKRMNMKNIKSKIQIGILLILTGIIITFACKKDEIEYERNRLFSPVINTDLEADGNTIIVSLGNLKGAQYYTIYVSRDTLNTIDYTFTVDTTYFVINSDLTGEELLWNVRYQIAGKAHADDTIYDSNISFLGEILTDSYPTNMITPNEFDVLDVMARVKWHDEGEPIDKIIVYAEKALDVRLKNPLLEFSNIQIETDSLSDKYTFIAGLEPETNYQIAIYSGDKLRGWKDFTTKAASVSGDNVISLTGITNDSILLDTLPTLADGSIILLEGGKTYVAGGYGFDKSVTIQSGLSFVQAKPLITCASNYRIRNNSTIGSITFKDIAFEGDFSGNYVFNIDSSGTIGEISFENCEIHSLRGVTRIKDGTGTIDKFTIKNTVVDSINGYGIFFVDKDTWTAGDITIEESTFSKCIVFLASKTNTNSVNIKNCTMNQIPEQGRPILRWHGAAGNTNVTSGINIELCIWGAGWNQSDPLGVTAVKGYEGLESTAITVTNCFATADFSFSTSPITGFPSTQYTETGAEVWVNPDNVDFNFQNKNQDGASTAGDPRWKPN